MDLHSNIGDLEAYVDGHLSEEQSTAVRAHLEGCKECQLRLTDIALEGRWKGPERRGEPRVAVNFPCRVKQLDPVTSAHPPHEAEIVEISRAGLKIFTPRLLITKTLVQIRFNNQAVLGEVRYCIEVDGGYHAGIKLVDDFPGTA
jgi:hypothetical protein